MFRGLPFTIIHQNTGDIFSCVPKGKQYIILYIYIMEWRWYSISLAGICLSQISFHFEICPTPIGTLNNWILQSSRLENERGQDDCANFTAIFGTYKIHFLWNISIFDFVPPLFAIFSFRRMISHYLIFSFQCSDVSLVVSTGSWSFSRADETKWWKMASERRRVPSRVWIH